MKIDKETGGLSDFCCDQMGQGIRAPGEFLSFQAEWKEHSLDLPHPAICIYKRLSGKAADSLTGQSSPAGDELTKISYCPFCGAYITFNEIFGNLEPDIKRVREKHEGTWAKMEGVDYEKDRAEPRGTSLKQERC